ncbi:M56 family metallopeptidase [Pontibacter akesuensis]|uniref:Signal transducer regulating beta-lactamase production, contains metallopeptidase domain n=1 Tax=Pontibacter akesuensis TaxID=388950 RepID=A0A1I7JG28_9BACT|nr:M56 family metallopeptidase [Pontibacter akesuensis]GHA70215.1 hypothetical protein GCM10007389_24360 [Pontibacter akesuensis]SFU84114.1 Signal transducer regulating beta-lactamase production, contains metallopeptidase domain [Pontibacter akesuensis]
MPTLLLYLLKVNVALVLFYLAYHLVLRRLTFYHLNRLFLVFAVLFSSLYPFVDLAELFGQQQELVSAYAVTVPAHWMTATNLPAQETAFDYWQIPIILFWAGVAVMAFRLLLQFVSLYQIHTSSEPKAYKSISFRQIRNISQAFSFWQTIYLNPAQHRNEELEAILRHEQIHVRGWHTLDVLLAELSTVFYWFNPGVWLMKKAIKENLEFIADQHVVSAGVDRKAYQYLILKALATPEPQLANQFNFPSLKRRIAMMNKVPTRKAHQLRLLIALPLAAVLLLAFRSASEPIDKFVDEMSLVDTGNATTNTSSQGLSKDYEDFFRRNLNVTEIAWLPDDLTGSGNRFERIMIGSRNSFEVFGLKKESDMSRFVTKYGNLPTAPADPSNIIQIWKSSGKIVIGVKAGAEEAYTFGDKEKQTPAQDGDGKLPKALVDLLMNNPAVKNVKGKIVENRNAIVINLKGGGTEVYYLDSTESIAALKRKYELPELPPPPPPVRDAAELPAPPPPPAPAAPDAPAAPAPAAPDAEVLPPPPPPAPAELKAYFPDGVIYYVDGKEDKNETYKQLDPKQIHSINVYKGESAQKVFGKKAAKGVISIITEKNKDSRQVQEFKEKFPALPAPPPPAPAEEQLPPPPPPVKVDADEAFTYVMGVTDAFYQNEANLPEDHKAFLKRNPEVKHVGFKFNNRKEFDLLSFVVYLKSGGVEEYKYNGSKTIPAAESKYGKLPGLPAPPPPTRAK